MWSTVGTGYSCPSAVRILNGLKGTLSRCLRMSPIIHEDKLTNSAAQGGRPLLAFGTPLQSSLACNFAKIDRSSSVVVSPVTALPLATSFSKRRMIFPLRVLGNASANRI
jgi:hypothetical protein